MKRLLIALFSALVFTQSNGMQPSFYRAAHKNPITVETAQGSRGLITQTMINEASLLRDQQQDNCTGNALLLPSHMNHDDARLIMPFLSLASKVKNRTKSPEQLRAALAVFQPAKLAQLVNNADAIGAEHLLDVSSTVLAEKLQEPEHLKNCLRTGTYNLNLPNNHPCKTLILQKMLARTPANSYWLLKEQVINEGKNNESPCRYLDLDARRRFIWNSQDDTIQGVDHPDYQTCITQGKELRCIIDNFQCTLSMPQDQPMLTITNVHTNNKIGSFNWPYQSLEPLWHATLHQEKSLLACELGEGTNQSIRILNLKTGDIISEFPTKQPFEIRFDPRGEKLAAATLDKTNVHLWNLETSEHHVLQGHQSYVLDVSFNTSGSQLVSAGGNDNTARIWNTQTLQCLKVIDPRKGKVSQAFFTNNDTCIITVHPHEICIWDINSGTLLQTIKNYPFSCIKLGIRSSPAYLNNGGNRLITTHNRTWRDPKLRMHTLFNTDTQRYLSQELAPEQSALLIYAYEKSQQKKALEFWNYPGISTILNSFPTDRLSKALIQNSSWKDRLYLKLQSWLQYFRR